MEIIKGKSTDGITYTGLLSRAANKENLILHIHGMSGDIYFNSFYPFMHEYYPKNGWSFLAVEHRGTHSVTQFDKNGSSVNLGNAYETFEDCVFDIQGWIDTAKSMGFKNIWLQSHSLGPSKVAYYISQTNSTDIKGLIFLSPSDMVGLVNYPEEVERHKKLLAEAQELVKLGKSDQLLSDQLWGETLLSAKTYISFFGENAKDAIFNFLMPELGFEAVNNINLPVLAFTGTQDDGIVPCMDPYMAMQVLEKELKNSPRIKTIVLKNAEHDFAGFGQNIVEEVIRFLSE